MIIDLTTLYEEGINDSPCGDIALDVARNPEQPRSCTFNTELMRHASYQATMDTSQQLMTDQGETGAAG